MTHDYKRYRLESPWFRRLEMSDTTTEHPSAGQLADQASHAIHELNHRAQPSGDDLVFQPTSPRSSPPWHT